MSEPRLTYRPEIDGLRAVAVLAVILFHADLSFPGGYAGVDVFFVISGFLITQLIRKAVDEQRFSMANFWERRIRRLVPAMVVVIAATYLLGVIILLPNDLVKLGESAVAQVFVVANFYFYSQVDYFIPAADRMPLLHTWSLSVEEQFYLLYPLVFAKLWGWKPNVAKLLICLGLLASLAFSAFEVTHNPQANYYLLPSRGWQLLLGAVFAVHLVPPLKSRWLEETAGWAGLIAIAATFFLFDQATPFPGVAALLPCLGAALVIHANRDRLTSSGQMLALKPIVFVGLISYGLYLWHWPLLVSIDYLSVGEAPLILRLAAIALAIMFSAASWKWLETPIRHRKLMPKPRRIFAGAAVAMPLLLGVAAILTQSGGLPQRFEADTLNKVRNARAEIVSITDQGKTRIIGNQKRSLSTADVRSRKLMFLGDASADPASPYFLLWCDSHGNALTPNLHLFAKAQGVCGYVANRNGNVPLPGVYNTNKGRETLAYNAAVMEFIRKHRPKQVIIAARWAAYLEGMRSTDKSASLVRDAQSVEATTDAAYQATGRALEATLDELGRLGVHVWILKQVPWQPDDVPQMLAMQARFSFLEGRDFAIDRATYESQQHRVNQFLDGYSGPQVTLLDPSPYLFDASGKSVLMRDGHILYRDDDHISWAGAVQLQPLLRPIFEGAGEDEADDSPHQGKASSP